MTCWSSYYQPFNDALATWKHNEETLVGTFKENESLFNLVHIISNAIQCPDYCLGTNIFKMSNSWTMNIKQISGLTQPRYKIFRHEIKSGNHF